MLTVKLVTSKENREKNYQRMNKKVKFPELVEGNGSSHWKMCQVPSE